MKFPHTVRFRALTATIYGKSAGYPFYRLAVRVAGKRLVRSFQTFAEAKAEAEAKLREVAKGNQSAGLNAKESAEALAIREAVQIFYRDTGRKVSALQAVNGYLASLRVLPVNVSPEETDGNKRKPLYSGKFRRKFPLSLPPRPCLPLFQQIPAENLPRRRPLLFRLIPLLLRQKFQLQLNRPQFRS